jgi:LytS/YehU family sensor histidine kinase
MGVTAYHAYRQGERLKTQLQQTELLLYRAQLEPHFMFNTLNSIAALVRLDRREAATDALHHLSSLLRGVLEVGQRQVMPWQWEREFAGTYIALQQLRFADRLDVRIDATDVPTHAPVPVLLLQPLLENAIVHGPLADGRRCEIVVRLRSAGQRLELCVENEVARTASTDTHGMGLVNMRARLCALFGDDCRFEHRRDGARFVVAAAFPIGAA